jgi:NAD(P)-dependent dehydrogenase (short-subunit alcohol dehydrogenase family)
MPVMPIPNSLRPTKDPYPDRPISERPVAVVTGANRGLGMAAAEGLARRGYAVVLTARSLAKAETVADYLNDLGLDVIPMLADVSRPATLEPVGQFVDEKFGRIDALVNNAGIFPESDAECSVFDSPYELIEKAFRVNTLGAVATARVFVPLMKRRRQGCIVNVSSGMAGLTEMNGGNPAYRFSKVALNALTRILADELQNTQIRVNSVCPGWVRTDMGGAGAKRSIEEGVAGILWAATLPPDGPTGGFFRDGNPIPW